jgi:hypothetical protein
MRRSIRQRCMAGCLICFPMRRRWCWMSAPARAGTALGSPGWHDMIAVERLELPRPLARSIQHAISCARTAIPISIDGRCCHAVPCRKARYLAYRPLPSNPKRSRWRSFPTQPSCSSARRKPGLDRTPPQRWLAIQASVSTLRKHRSLFQEQTRALAPAPLARTYRHLGRTHRRDGTDQPRHPAHRRGRLLRAVIAGPAHAELSRIGQSRVPLSQDDFDPPVLWLAHALCRLHQRTAFAKSLCGDRLAPHAQADQLGRHVLRPADREALVVARRA